MSEEKNETLDSTNEGEAVETPEKDNQSEQPDRIAELEKKFADLEKKNKQLFERAKKAEEKAKEVKVEKPDENMVDKLAKLEKNLAEATFYADHPEYKEYKKYISRFGENPEEAVATEDFKELFDKLEKGKKEQGSKTILETNNRLGQSKDHLKKARDMVKTAKKLASENDVTGFVDATNQANDEALAAVLEAFPKTR